jgi:hypothetical protein
LRLRAAFPEKNRVNGRRLLGSVLRIALALFVIFGLVWFFGIRMPGRNISSAAALNESEVALRAELAADVQKLAGEIGERNMSRYPQLLAASDFIETSFAAAGLRFRLSFPELAGRTNGLSGNAVIVHSWSRTPRRFAIRTTTSRPIRLRSSTTIGLLWWSAGWRR